MRFAVLSVCVAAQILLVSSKILPDYLPHLCSERDPNYNECTLKSLTKLGPYLLKGIREIHFPKLHPLDIPLFEVNRTLNEYVSITAILKNVQMYGFNTTYIKNVKFDPRNKQGELHLNIPYLRVTMEYDVIGRLAGTDFTSAGYFKGNATDIDLLFKFRLKRVEQLGVKHYAFADFEAHSTIGGGYVKMTARNPDDQPIADFVTNFFNENPSRTIDAVQPIYEESVNWFYKTLAEQVLASIPADELIPE